VKSIQPLDFTETKMNKVMIAVAMTIAFPAAALAQATTSAAAPAAHSGHDMKAMDCKDMHANMSGGHSGHKMSGAGEQADHSKMGHGKMDHSKMAAACGDKAKAGEASSHQSHSGH